MGIQVKDVQLLPWTYPWPKRFLVWMIWKCPVFRLPFRLLLPRKWNPYRKVVKIMEIGGDNPFQDV